MKYASFVLKHLRHNPVRAASTILAMAVCIFLYCTLQTALAAVTWNLRSANASRLVTRHAFSMVFNLPPAHGTRIAAVPGVRRVAAMNWFGGLYKGPRNFFPNVAVEAEPFLAMYPEYILSASERAAFLADQRGCIIGRKTAERFGWKLGDAFQMESFIPLYRTLRPFEFVVRGIFDSDEDRYPGTDTTAMYFHWKYLREATNERAMVGIYTTEIADPAQAAAVGKAIDALFANSERRTRTQPEAAFRAGFVSMIGNLALLVNGIGLAAMFTILLVTANTMSMAVRERRTEIAVLKTIGFPSRLVMSLLLGESVALGMVGGTIGVVVSGAVIRHLPHVPFVGEAVRGFPHLALSASVGAAGLSIAMALGLVAGLVPAALAYRARIADMLRPL
jgi:putative ABC transport system permease protein